MKWLLESSFEITADGIRIQAPKKSDYFVDPKTANPTCSAAFLYQDVCGDFVLRAHVHHDFIATYDACCLMAYESDTLWAKACFELSDFNTHTIVSVMTNERSDDGNGVNINEDCVWLQLARTDNVFTVHYSLDGVTFYMVRLTHLPMKKDIKVGFVAQSPLGDGGMRSFTQIHFEQTSLTDIRKGTL